MPFYVSQNRSDAADLQANSNHRQEQLFFGRNAIPAQPTIITYKLPFRNGVERKPHISCPHIIGRTQPFHYEICYGLFTTPGVARRRARIQRSGFWPIAPRWKLNLQSGEVSIKTKQKSWNRWSTAFEFEILVRSHAMALCVILISRKPGMINSRSYAPSAGPLQIGIN